MSWNGAVIGSLIAALLFAGANNLQRHAAASDHHAGAGPVRLFLGLLRTPRWLLGGGVALVALFFHARALSQGGVILVQSVIATTLVFSIVIEAIVERRWLRPRELLGAVVVVLGIVLVVDVGRPGVADEFRSPAKELLVLAVVAVVGGGALMRSHYRPRGRRTALTLGAAAGVCFALDAVFLRAAAASSSPLDPVVLIRNVIGFGAVSLLGNLVVARAYQSAPLRHVLPGVAAAEPLAAFATGRFVFGEHLQEGTIGVLAVSLGLSMMLIGVVLCALGSAYRQETTAVSRPPAGDAVGPAGSAADPVAGSAAVPASDRERADQKRERTRLAAPWSGVCGPGAVGWSRRRGCRRGVRPSWSPRRSPQSRRSWPAGRRPRTRRASPWYHRLRPAWWRR